MLQVNEDSKRRCIQMVLCISFLSLANTLSANEIVQGDGDDQEPFLSPVKISVVTGSEKVSYPAIWGNYVVWKGAVNEVYAIDQNAKVPMPGLKIDGVPAIWENIVVWEGSEHYYDLETQAREPMYVILPVGSNPAISNRKIVWENSLGYFDIDLDSMVYTKDFIVGDSPDIDGDRVVWSGSKGYYDIEKQKMIQPWGLDVGLDPAIHGQKITWSYLKGGYYDLDLETYGHARIITGQHPDIFGNRLLWLEGDEISNGPIAVWEQACGTQIVLGPMFSTRAQIYGSLVVWGRRQEKCFYMSRVPSCCGDEDHPYPEGDINHDCRVDFKDLALLTRRWLEDTGVLLEPRIKVTVRLDKAVYAMDDEMQLDITAFNPCSEPATLLVGLGSEVSYRIDGISDSFFWDYALSSAYEMTIAPNASRTWTRNIPIQGHYHYTFTPGTHSITGVVHGYAESDMIEFEIIAE